MLPGGLVWRVTGRQALRAGHLCSSSRTHHAIIMSPVTVQRNISSTLHERPPHDADGVAAAAVAGPPSDGEANQAALDKGAMDVDRPPEGVAGPGGGGGGGGGSGGMEKRSYGDRHSMDRNAPQRSQGRHGRDAPRSKPEILARDQLNSILTQATVAEDMLQATHVFRKTGLNPINCAIVMNRLGRLCKDDSSWIQRDRRYQRILQRIETLMVSNPHQITPSHLARIIKGLGHLTHHPGKEFMDLCTSTCLANDLATTKPSHLAACVTGMANIGYQPGPKFTSAVARGCTTSRFADFDPAQLCNTVHGLALLHHQELADGPFMTALLDRCGVMLVHFETKDVSKLMTGLTKLCPGLKWNNAFMDAVVEACMRLGLDNFRPSELASIIHAMGKFQALVSKDFLSSFSKACVSQKFRSFRDEQMACILSSLTRLDYRPSNHFLAAFAEDCRVRGLHNLKKWEANSIMFALCKLEYNPGKPLLRQYATAYTQSTDPVDLQALQQVLFCIKTFAFYDEDMIDHLIHLYDPAMLPPTRHSGRDHARVDAARHVVSSLNSLTSLNHDPGEAFLARMAATCMEIGFQHFNAGGISNSLHSFARMRFHPGDEWLDAALMELSNKGPRDNTFSELSLVVWSLAVLDVLEERARTCPIFPRLMVTLMNAMEAAMDELIKVRRNREEDRRQTSTIISIPAPIRLIKKTFPGLRHALLSLELSGSPELLELREATERCFQRSGLTPPHTTVSDLQQSVAEMLTRLGYVTEREAKIMDGRLSLDVGILPVKDEAGGVPIGVEVDGPGHFYRNQDRLRTGSAVYKNRLLRLALKEGKMSGFINVSLPMWWKAFKNGYTGAYLENLLKKTPADMSCYRPDGWQRRSWSSSVVPEEASEGALPSSSPSATCPKPEAEK